VGAAGGLARGGAASTATFLFHSRDDEEIPIAHLDRYAKRLPMAEVYPLDGCGHLYERGDLSPMVSAVKSL
jgi:pimeloyl-ACP methyl ester carboxylesterase